jgi:uncharacterized protein (TIGR02677 family)
VPEPLGKPFAHVHAPNAMLYRAVMGVFVAARRRFLVHLRPEDVAEAIAAADQAPAQQLDDVAEALTKLKDWGNLRADPDTARVTTVDDFYRPRFLYQLTREGEAAETALDAFDQALGRPGELQSVALADIRLRLRSLLDQAGRSEPDAAVVHGLLRELSDILDGLAANASAFMGGLARTLDLNDVDETAFLAYKDRLLGYLDRFIGELVTASADIAGTLASIDGPVADRLLRLAAAREATDAAPDATGQDTDPLPARLESWRQRWSGLRDWFIGDPARPSQADLLRRRALSAIPALLTAVSTLNERRAGRSDRSADFRTLALWFAEAPTEAGAHRLWRAAFGLSAARHLTVDAATLDSWREQPVAASTPWAQAPPVVVNPRLRATGRHQRRGPMARIQDRTDARRLLAEHLARERVQTDAARRRLAVGRPVRLRDLGTLDADEFGVFLGLLGDALSSGPPGADGSIRATTSDGSLAVELTPVADGVVAEIVTPDGILRGPDHVIVVTDLTAALASQGLEAGAVPAAAPGVAS